MVQREKVARQSDASVHATARFQSFEELENSPEFATLAESKLEEARQRVLTSLLGTVVREEKLAVSEEEMGPYFAELAALQPASRPVSRVCSQ